MTRAGIKAAVVLLAAGLSRRMGERNKLLIEIEGEPLVRRTAKTYLATGAMVHAVLGHEAEQVRAALAGLSLTFVENPRFADGQPASVRAGLDSLPDGYDAVFIALADQAALTPGDIADLLRTFADGGGDRILVPYYRGQRGNPAVFPSKIIREIRASGGNVACRSFIESNPKLTRRYEAQNDHFVLDIDTPEDLQAFENAQRPTPS
jgi:molybdenum cofactor cytidylyltransferase